MQLNEQPKPAPSLLIVEDSPTVRQMLAYYFEMEGFEVGAAGTVCEAKALFESRRPGRGAWSLIISDYHLPDGDGMELCKWVRRHQDGSPPFLLISGVAKAASFPGVDFLAKPFEIPELEKRVRTLLHSADPSGS